MRFGNVVEKEMLNERPFATLSRDTLQPYQLLSKL